MAASAPAPSPSLVRRVLDALHGASFEPRDPDHFAGPGFRQQEPELASELGHAARG